MPTDPSSSTISTVAIVLIAFWALVILPLFALVIRALVRTSYPLGRNPRRFCLVWLVFGLLVLLLPPSGYLTRSARVLLVISLILLAVTWLFFPLSLLFPAFQIALEVGWPVTIISIILAVGAMLLSEEPDKDNR